MKNKYSKVGTGEKSKHSRKIHFIKYASKQERKTEPKTQGEIVVNRECREKKNLLGTYILQTIKQQDNKCRSA